MGSILDLPTVGLNFLATKIEDFGRWCKWMIAYTYIEIGRRHTKQRFDLYDMDTDDDPVKIGLIYPKEEIILESPMDESELHNAADEVVFYGVNSSSECFMAKVSRSCHEAEVVMHLKLRNGKVYEMQNRCCYQQAYKNRMFAGGGLRMYYTEPMRKWRIFFKGLMRESSSSDATPNRMVYVKFGLQWKAGTDCFDTFSDINSSDLARALSKIKWHGRLPHLKGFFDAVNSYCQGGVIRGEVSIDGAAENLEVYLFGEKIRYLGNASNINGYRFSHLLGHINEDGRMIHISEIHIPSVTESLTFGFVVNPEGQIQAASKIEVTEGNLHDENKSVRMNFKAENREFRLKANISEKKYMSEFGSKESRSKMENLTLEVNSRPGRGILIQGNTHKLEKKTISKSTVRNVKDIPVTVNFSDAICQIPEVTGGKGSSLGKLTELSRIYKNFIVPKWVVVTNSAYENFITDDILKEIRNLEDILYEISSGDVKEACKRASGIIVSTDLKKEIRQSILENLQKEFGASYNKQMFAVRSSATAEDSEDISAAGQMETFLGVSGLEQIILSVKKCWASQFSYVAVQHKRQNGQVLNGPMAVVIQEVISCDLAGVLFTCDPLTGNPTLMSITANYGLGESVVSGSEEPDTVILERDAKANLKVKEKIIGAKNRRTVIKGGVAVPEEVSKAEREVCSLPDELSLFLGKIAVNIEESYGSERDIEWGYWNNDIYIFQSRPVTSNNEETDYEIDHENDGPMRVENDYFSVCNVGEVMPGAMSPLGLEITLKLMNTVQKKREFAHFQVFSPKYCPKGLLTMHNHCMVNAVDLFHSIKEGESFVKNFMVSLFGRIIENEELFALVRERFAHRKKMSTFTKLSAVFKPLYSSSRRVKKAKKYYENYGLSLDDYKSSKDLFTALLNSCSYPSEALMCHFTSFIKSSMANMFLQLLLESAKGELDTDVYNDLSEILSSINEVESADVPAAMESLAYHIEKDIKTSDFQKMSIEDAEKWLMSSTSESGLRFRDFLKKHGHRCLKEYDIRTDTWEQSPQKLVKLLQNLTGSVSDDRSNKKKTFQEIMSKLKNPLTNFTKILLRLILLPLSRSGVQDREASKSLLIKAINEWRKGYKKLAKLMVSEGRIPDEDLIFFMPLIEIQELLLTRSPKIISRATHRRRRHPILDSYIFPEISTGIPKPVFP